MRTLTIDQKEIGQERPVFVVAEAGINHGGDLRTALRMVEGAAGAGADAVKFQTYLTEKRVHAGHPLFDYLKDCELDEKAHWEIHGFCQDKRITFMSTAFDEESVGLLQNLNVPVIKVASFDIVNLTLLRTVASTRIPVIMSTGMANTDEVETGVGVFEDAGVPYALLHCVSAYPAVDRDANLRAMTTLRERFGCPVGFSDHTLGIRTSVYAVLAGAVLVEKHFTLDRRQEGPDHLLSVEPADFKSMVGAIREAEAILGSRRVTRYPSEEGTLPYRRFSD